MSTERVTDHVTGGDDNLPASLVEQIGLAAKALDEATEQYKADRNDIAKEARDAAAIELTELKRQQDAVVAKAAEARDQEIDQLLAWSKTAREPSKAGLIGMGLPQDRMVPTYQPGAFAYHLFARKSEDFSIEDRMKAEAVLREMGIRFMELPQQGPLASKGSITPGGASDPLAVARGGFEIPQAAVEAAAGRLLRSGRLGNDQHARAIGIDPLGSLAAKATLGTSSGVGGILIPGATVSDLVKPARYRSAVPRLVDSMNVNAYQTTIPVRNAAPSRAAVVAWGVTKTNRDLAYDGYTATMFTMALIYDAAKQLLRFSAGAVEQDILSELAHSFELGAAYYILQGAGTTEPYGIQTAIANSPATFTSSFSASATTLAGSIATALTTAAGALATRNRAPEAALLGAAGYWTMISQGTDEAGFFMPAAGSPLNIRVDGVNGGIAPWGLPIYPETQLAGTDDLLVGEFSALDVFYGESYRVDTSDVAGDRWDKNLVGFRGEQEIGLDARPAVYAGAFQFVADVIP